MPISESPFISEKDIDFNANQPHRCALQNAERTSTHRQHFSETSEKTNERELRQIHQYALFEQKTSTRDPGQRAWQANPEEEARAETFKQAGGGVAGFHTHVTLQERTLLE
ncbi:MAG: hypothetical protein Q9161_004285 [Pseudevernia consocians]